MLKEKNSTFYVKNAGRRRVKNVNKLVTVKYHVPIIKWNNMENGARKERYTDVLNVNVK
jgi:hypothetical protein